jgi:RNA polymerase primary sigma factor
MSAVTAVLEETEMTQPEESGANTTRVPPHIIETVNRVMRTSRHMLPEIGREPTPEELAEKLAMPLEKVHKILEIARRPIRLETPVGDDEDSRLT